MPAKWPPSAVGEPTTTIGSSLAIPLRIRARLGCRLRASRTGRDALRHNREMRIAEFALERYFARWEFSVEHLLCASDVAGPPDERAPRPGRRRDPRPVGRSHPGLRGIDRSSAPASRDRRHVRRPRARGRPGLRRRGGGDLLSGQRAAGAGRPRRRHVAGLPEPVRDRPGDRRGRHPARAARGCRLGTRSRPPPRAGHVGDQAHRGERAAQPDRHAPGPIHVRWPRGHRRGGRCVPAAGRGLPIPRVRIEAIGFQRLPTPWSGASRWA